MAERGAEVNCIGFAESAIFSYALGESGENGMDDMSFMIVLACLGLAIWALNRNSRLDKRISALSLAVGKLSDEVAALRAGGVLPASQDAAVTAENITETPISEDQQAVTGAGESAPPPEELPDLSPAAAANENVAAAIPGKPRDVEQALASRWFVWIGGLAIAIGGVLFVKYAFDSGWISPFLQCLIGLLAGLALIAGGSLLRRSSFMQADHSYVPAALSAAGLVTAFGSIYAAYAFYELIPPLVAFGGLALVALGAFALSLTQGPLIAALGLIGSYGTPTLIPSEDPSAWTFFPYLLVILVACFAVSRVKSWGWLAYAAIAGSLAWALLWANGGVFEATDILPLGLFGLALGGLSLFGLGQGGYSRFISPQTAGVVAGLLILCANVVSSRHGGLAFGLLLAGGAGIVAPSLLRGAPAALAVVAAVLSLFTLSAWFEGDFWQIAYDEMGRYVPIIGAGAKRFLVWVVAFGALFMLSGYAGLRRLSEPARWAGLSAGAAILFGLLGWMRAYDVLTSGQWMLAAGLVALLFVAAIWSLRQRVDEPDLNLGLGFLAIAATIAAAMGLQEAFSGVWLSVALAVLVPVLALASLRIDIRLLGWIAGVVAGVVAIRLFLARELFDGENLLLGRHWPLYGYGIPLVLFWVSSRLFARTGQSRSVAALEGAALGLAIALISLELRIIIAGGVRGDAPGLLECGAYTVAWLGAAYGLMHRLTKFSSLVSLWGARLLIAAALVLLIGGSLLWLNPAVNGDPLAGGALFNALLLAYLAPAILIGLISRRLPVLYLGQLAPFGGVLALVLGLAYLTLQTKRLFQGPVMVAWATSDAESYAYSAVWLVAALMLFVAGILFNRKYVRMAGLVVMILVVLKVFLVDLSGIGGLYRIASFVGLGLCLVGIGWLYARFVQKPKAISGERA